MKKIGVSLALGVLSLTLSAPAMAQDATPPLNPADTTAEATDAIGPGARPVGANWSRSPVAAARA